MLYFSEPENQKSRWGKPSARVRNVYWVATTLSVLPTQFRYWSTLALGW